jgi:D-xylose transport system ATP-binding protein
MTVLRDGASVITLKTEQASKPQIIKHMVGREINDLFPRRRSKSGAAALEVEGLSVADSDSGQRVLSDISFSLRAGEVLGIGGLMGAGRTELLMHLFGAWGSRLSGSVHLNGRELQAQKPEEIIRRGMVLVSEDRRRYGLILDKTIGFNLSLSSLAKLTKKRLIDEGLEFQKNNHFFQSLRVKAPTLEALVAKLSGGTQQKVVLGKALMTEPLVIFLDEPTRGIDVGAKLEIYEIVNQLTDAGKAVLLVSSELPELIGMSDRILVLHEGRIGGEFDRDEATQENLLAAAMGQRQVMLT